MSKSNVVLKIIVAGAAMYGSYKLFKWAEKYESDRVEKLEKHRKEVLEELAAEFHEMEEWNSGLKEVTLNNTLLKPSDRAYAYDLIKEKYEAVMEAKSIEAIDSARKELEELLDILMTVKNEETVETFLKICADKRAQAEKLRQEKAAHEIEIEKYKAISGVIERIGTKVVCSLTQ